MIFKGLNLRVLSFLFYQYSKVGEGKMNNLIRKSKRFFNKNGATILTCVGAAGVVATSIMAVKATPKALTLIEKAEEKKGEKLTKFETVKTAGPVYIPAIITGAATVSCIFGANVLNKRQQAALASAYALLDNSYKEYKKKAIELYGVDADKEIVEEIARDKYEEEDDSNPSEDDGKKLFYDIYSSRYFRATPATVSRAAYELNRMVAEDCYASLNEWFELVGLETTDYGEYVGWSSSQLYEMYWTNWIHFKYDKATMDDGLECMIVSYTEPLYNFEDY